MNIRELHQGKIKGLKAQLMAHKYDGSCFDLCATCEYLRLEIDRHMEAIAKIDRGIRSLGIPGVHNKR